MSGKHIDLSLFFLFVQLILCNICIQVSFLLTENWTEVDPKMNIYWCFPQYTRDFMLQQSLLKCCLCLKWNYWWEIVLVVGLDSGSHAKSLTSFKSFSWRSSVLTWCWVTCRRARCVWHWSLFCSDYSPNQTEWVFCQTGQANSKTPLNISP